MSNKVDYSVHPNNPAAQPFQGRGTPNKTKKNSWWNVNSSSYWRNKKPTKQQHQQEVDSRAQKEGKVLKKAPKEE